MKYRIKIDEELCIGCGACTSCENFELSDSGKAKVIKSLVDEDDCSKDSQDICPVGAITVKEVRE